MTCICAVAEDGVVVVGGDAALSDDNDDQTLAGPKVFERRGLLIGVSGMLRIGQLLAHAWDGFPTRPADADPLPWLVRDFCIPLQSWLGEINADDLVVGGDDDDEQWMLLVGVHGRLFRVCSHLEVVEPRLGYAATGSGGPFALGSLASTEGQEPRRRIETALAASARHNAGVAPPFTILSTGG